MTTNTLSTERLISLNLTLDILLNRQEKTWGCFQVIKEGDFYTLQIPTVSNLKLFTNPQSIGYKGYWREPFSDRLPDVKDRKEKPDIYTRKKTKKVEVDIGNPAPKNNSAETTKVEAEQTKTEKVRKKKNSDKSLKLKPKISKIIKLKQDINVESSQEPEQIEVETVTPTKELQLINPSRIARPKTIQKKQTVFEVIYRYSNCPEINFLNKIITSAICDHIQNDATFDSMTEIMPLVLVKSADE